jgi:hypothetical protein
MRFYKLAAVPLIIGHRNMSVHGLFRPLDDLRLNSDTPWRPHFLFLHHFIGVIISLKDVRIGPGLFQISFICN